MEANGSMKRGKLLIGVLCCFLTLFAFSTKTYAMGFDAEDVYESVFVVYSGDYIGSGFAIGSNTVVTNAHVIGNTNDVQIYTYSGDVYRASVYLIDNSFDIAVLSVENADFIPLEVGDCETVKTGDDIYAIGAPKSMGYTLTKGIVSNKERSIGKYNYIQIDAAINAGNSGGPLLNNDGKVIGVNSMKASDSEGIGFAIPMSAVISFIENNGVTIKENNNVEGNLPFIENTIKGENGNDSDAERVVIQNHSGSAILTLGILLGISVFINVTLIIFIVYQKNKNRDYYPDKSERTDFDIDIQE